MSETLFSLKRREILLILFIIATAFCFMLYKYYTYKTALDISIENIENCKIQIQELLAEKRVLQSKLAVVLEKQNMPIPKKHYHFSNIFLMIVVLGMLHYLSNAQTEAITRQKARFMHLDALCNNTFDKIEIIEQKLPSISDDLAKILFKLNYLDNKINRLSATIVDEMLKQQELHGRLCQTISENQDVLSILPTMANIF